MGAPARLLPLGEGQPCPHHRPCPWGVAPHGPLQPTNPGAALAPNPALGMAPTKIPVAAQVGFAICLSGARPGRVLAHRQGSVSPGS